MPPELAELLDLLDLELIDVNLYRGVSPRDSWQRVYGGQVLAQALVAAQRTVEGLQAHSLHAYFLRAGDPKTPILYEVDRIRDGRSFTTRRVVARQKGQAIFNMSASFHKAEGGLSHAVAMPEVVGPETIQPEYQRRVAMAEEVPEAHRTWFLKPRPIELRPIDPAGHRDPKPKPPFQNTWCRAIGDLPDDPALHRAILAYASDMTLLDSALMPHGIAWIDPRIMTASLDHAMWFHRDPKADDWLLYAQTSPASGGARGFTQASFFAQDGTLIASCAQEGLIRLIEPTAPATD